MDEMYRMLGREHQADLDREASKHALASRLPSRRPGLTRQALTHFWWLATRTDTGGANVGDAAASSTSARAARPPPPGASASPKIRSSLRKLGSPADFVAAPFLRPADECCSRR